LGLGAWGLGLEAWGLGLGAWGLRLGAWGLRLEIPSTVWTIWLTLPLCHFATAPKLLATGGRARIFRVAVRTVSTSKGMR